MNDITIGIPRAMLYYVYGDLWESFFSNLGVKYIVSPVTNKKIVNRGIKLTNDEACLSLKLLIGHIDYLKNKCDYLFVPRIGALKKKEVVCTNYNALYDIARNIFAEEKILHYNLDIPNKNYESSEFIKLGKSLGFDKKVSKLAYLDAIKKVKVLKEEKKLERKNFFKSPKKKVMLVGHEYNLKEEIIGSFIKKYLNSFNIDVTTSDGYVKNKNLYRSIMPTMYFSFNKRYINSLLNDIEKLDGVILVSSFPCGNDSLVNEMVIRKIKDIPLIYIIFDDISNNSGLITRLESFIDIVKGEI